MKFLLSILRTPSTSEDPVDIAASASLSKMAKFRATENCYITRVKRPRSPPTPGDMDDLAASSATFSKKTKFDVSPSSADDARCSDVVNMDWEYTEDVGQTSR